MLAVCLFERGTVVRVFLDTVHSFTIERRYFPIKVSDKERICNESSLNCCLICSWLRLSSPQPLNTIWYSVPTWTGCCLRPSINLCHSVISIINYCKSALLINPRIFNAVRLLWWMMEQYFRNSDWKISSLIGIRRMMLFKIPID